MNESNGKGNWSKVAEECRNRYNETNHSVTGFSPKYLLSECVRRRKRRHDVGFAEEVVIRGKYKFKIGIYLPVLGVLYIDLLLGLEAYREMNSLFGFVTEFMRKTNYEIKEAYTKLSERNSHGIEPEFMNEMLQFKQTSVRVLHHTTDECGDCGEK
ncbi:hypothetical protein EVAR_12352_1 [Eumeta japonica]|uniref:Uncharacterized protein n=1 Tax=Eumeta variegata TaxID=151549 RepID=A0A4C1X0I6_EUMVA|nr:hypothetical protein EVAR_12352_1 [Eumeta japonica]